MWTVGGDKWVGGSSAGVLAALLPLGSVFRLKVAGRSAVIAGAG